MYHFRLVTHLVDVTTRACLAKPDQLRVNPIVVNSTSASPGAP
jgi:hypothetical protein